MEPAQRWDLAPTGLHCVSVDPAGRLLACAGGDGDVRILDTAEEQVRTRAGAQGRWRCVTVYLVSCYRIGCCMATRTACGELSSAPQQTACCPLLATALSSCGSDATLTTAVDHCIE